MDAFPEQQKKDKLHMNKASNSLLTADCNVKSMFFLSFLLPLHSLKRVSRQNIVSHLHLQLNVLFSCTALTNYIKLKTLIHQVI